jgi:hypothetical protein
VSEPAPKVGIGLAIDVNQIPIGLAARIPGLIEPAPVRILPIDLLV